MIAAPLGTVHLAMETSTGHTHGICCAFDNLPHSLVGASIGANALRLELEGMGELVEQHATGFKIDTCRIASSKRTRHMVGAVEDVDVTASASFG